MRRIWEGDYDSREIWRQLRSYRAQPPVPMGADRLGLLVGRRSGRSGASKS